MKRFKNLEKLNYQHKNLKLKIAHFHYVKWFIYIEEKKASYQIFVDPSKQICTDGVNNIIRFSAD